MTPTKQGMLAAVAAVALIAGAGGAFAQADKKMESQGGAQAQDETQKKAGQAQTPKAPSGSSQQSGSGEKTAKDKDSMKPSQAQDSKPGAKQPGQAQQGKPEPRGQAQDTKPGAKQPGQAQDSKPGAKQPGQAQDSKPGAKQPSQAQDSKPGAKQSVQLNQEQRTRISQTVKQKNVNLRSVSRTEINFQINVGATVPRTFTFYPLPAPIVVVVPEFQGYLYIVVDGRLLIIHPQTYMIVAVLTV